MSADRISAGAVTRTELAELAALFDQFEFAFDPRSVLAREAESEFEDKLRLLFEQRVTPHHPHITLASCHGFLKKNSP